MSTEECLKLKEGDILSVVFKVNYDIKVLDNCNFLSEFEGNIYFDNREIRSYVHHNMAFHTHKEAVEKAIKIAKDSIAEFNYNISKLTNLIENLKQGDI